MVLRKVKEFWRGMFLPHEDDWKKTKQRIANAVEKKTVKLLKLLIKKGEIDAAYKRYLWVERGKARFIELNRYATSQAIRAAGVRKQDFHFTHENARKMFKRLAELEYDLKKAKKDEEYAKIRGEIAKRLGARAPLFFLALSMNRRHAPEE